MSGSVGTFLLFAGGEPDRGDDGRQLLDRFPRLRGVIPTAPAIREAPPGAGGDWGFPVHVQDCIDLVSTIGHDLGVGFRVIDVNRPGADGALVERWAGNDRLLPILVAPSGRFIEGSESFTPAEVKQFLRRG